MGLGWRVLVGEMRAQWFTGTSLRGNAARRQWRKAGLWQETAAWSEPLLVELSGPSANRS